MSLFITGIIAADKRRQVNPSHCMQQPQRRLYNLLVDAGDVPP